MKTLLKCLALICAYFLLTAPEALGQQTAKRTVSNRGYLEYLPPGYNSGTDTYPIMIFLHGAGEKGSGSAADLERVKRNGPPKEIENGHDMCFMVDGQMECFIVLSPQLKGSESSWWWGPIKEMVDHMLTGPDNYRFDPTRVYFTGLSLGGAGCWNAGYEPKIPDIFAAIAPVAAWGKNALACNINERKLNVWAFHGDQDNTVTYASGLGMFNSVQNCTTPAPDASQELIFTTYPGVGHNSWSRAYRTDNSLHDPNLYEWLLSKRKGGNPTANAGPDRNINLPTNSVVLNGSGSDSDGTITSYSWTKISGPSATLSNVNTANLTASNLVAGTYVFELTVTDNDGNTASDQATVVVNPEVVNQSPNANAGSDITLTLPLNNTNITGSGSDPDGSITGYQWTQNSGPNTANITNGSSAVVTVSGLVEGTYSFRLTVTDNLGATAFDDVTVTVNPAVVNQSPTANAGADQSLTLPTNSINLVGSGSDPDGTISAYLWFKLSGPMATLTNTTSSTLSLSNLIEGTYVFRLRVTDNDGSNATDDVTVTVISVNSSPVANAGPDRTITLPTSTVNLNGSGTDPDGSISSYSWAQVSGPNSATLANQTTPVLSASSLVEGQYVFRLTVTDNDGATDIDDAMVTVNAAPVNNPPTANAGADINITLPVNSVVINGTGTDSDGTVNSYAWIKISGPAATLTNANTPDLTASNLIEGTYVFRLTVTDDDGDTDTDDVTVNVAPAVVNQNPIVDAGPDQTVTLPKDNTSLISTASDPDGTLASFVWVQISGPNSATLSGVNNPTLGVDNMIEGVYTFRLTVTDNQGASSSDDALVTVNPANLPPDVNAGPDITLTLPTNSTDLMGNATDADGSISTYLWTQRSGAPATLSNQNTPTLSVSDLAEGTYVFRLTAIDNDSDAAFDEATVTVIPATTNELPVANAGADQTITLPTNTLVLNGSGFDNDGTITGYQWTKTSGPNVSLSNATTQSVTLSNLEEGSYVFRLTVTDNDGATDFDEATVTVNAASVNQLPVANAGPNETITLPVNSLNLVGSGTDPDGSISSYLWTKTSGPTATLTNATSSTVSLSNLIEGTYIFRLTVTDNDGDSDFDETTVTVQPEVVNQSPVADAGSDITLTLPTNSTNITGSGSDPDGTIASYAWTKLSGPAATITGASNPTLSVSNLIEGTYTFRLTVTDDDGAVDNDDMILTVNSAAVNQPPVADAGPDINISLPVNSAVINGSGSDNDGSITAYDWIKVSGPSVTLTNADQPSLSTSDLIEGTYVFRLTVTDNDGDTGSDDVQVIVQPAPVNNSPTADAGTDKTLVLPANTTTLTGSGSDSDGTIVSYDWTKTSGPAATLTDANTPTLSVSDMVEGNYTFRLTVTDDQGAIDSDEANVTVLPAASNQLPTVSAGPNQTLNLPTNSITLSGSASDSDGTIASTLWEKVSGPSVTIADATVLDLALSNMVEGTYLFRLTATDNDGDSDFDETTVTVVPASVNQTPSANAGLDVVLNLPTNSTTLNGSGTDPDGTIASFQWTKESGPNGGTLTGATTPDLSLSNLEEGDYVFRLTVTDDGGLTAFDEAIVSLLPEEPTSGVDPPIADAGEDQFIDPPTSTARLIGTADSQGLIASREWAQLRGDNVTLEGENTDTLDISNLQEGTYEFQYTVTDFEGSTDSDEVMVIVGEDNRPLDQAMKYFSPNNDGYNDFWILGDDLDDFRDCSLIIYDRQGIKVFEASPYLNDWDGTSPSGELPDGVYYYVLKCNGGDNSNSGSITVLR